MADLFDTRLYRVLSSKGDGGEVAYNVKPHLNIGSYVTDYFETPGEAAMAPFMKQTSDSPVGEEEKTEASTRSKELQEHMEELAGKNLFFASQSAIHPYALIRLAGASGSPSMTSTATIDETSYRKFYEIDGDSSGNYASNPTTTALINWGNSDYLGRFPYSFQDFVFCKYWNKIENNRLITLRRYASPVVDAVIPANYNDYVHPKDKKPTVNAELNKSVPYAPVCTAVTYFGEGTGNTLSDLLKFSVGYEWEEVTGDVWKVSSQQPDEGPGTTSPKWLQGGLQQLTRGLGIVNDLKYGVTGGKEGSPIIPTHAVALPPDPYNTGPYENRILGPMNVINKVMKRNRGLKFSQDGLSITFNYVARPIANINNKAILLDLLANILLMTSSSGTFFGGMHRYRTENPAVYPWRNMDSITNLYQGKLFGKSGAASVLTRRAWDDNAGFMTSFAKDFIDGVKTTASNLLAQITGKGEKQEKSGKAKAAGEAAVATTGRVISAHLLKGATIPYLNGMKAILTGEPVGEWHLTIGNPLNPIAMIGNLIVDDCEIKFSDELGPDDFPIGFTAVVKLKHGMGRDKDAVESMFNRGLGRMYILPDNFKTSADLETKVDDYTGGTDLRNKVESWSKTAFSGSDYIMTPAQKVNIPNSGDAGISSYTSLLNHQMDLTQLQASGKLNTLQSQYMMAAWTAKWLL